jgi:hypothetical protein
MANAVNYLSQIQTGQTIQAVHVNQFVEALSGSAAYDLVTSGSYTIVGPLYATASWATNALNANSSSYALSSSFATTSSFAVSASRAVSASFTTTASYAVSSTSALSSSYAVSASKAFIVDNGTTNADYTLVFKNSQAALDDYHQLGADGSNGPYYNPSTNVLGGLGGLTVSGSIGRFTSITGSLSGSVSGTASFATSASYALTSSYASNGVSTLSVGTFYDTTTQTVVSGASASITLNTPVINDGISVVSNSRLTVTRTGIYNLQFSTQVQTTVGGGPQVYIWLRKNGVNQTYSNTGLDIQNQNHKYVGAWNFVESLIAGDYLELVWYVNGGASAQLIAEAAGPTNGGVAVPSVIVTLTQIK